jgi:FHS family Na+ dependent glucose MFS transporter 1
LADRRSGAVAGAVELDGAAERRRTPWSGGIGAVAVYLVTFVSVGLSFGLIGPALSQLQDQVGSTVGAIGVLFTAQAFGYLVGSLVGGNLFDRGLGHRVLAGSLLVVAAALLAIPHVTSLVVLCAVFGLIGLGTGSADVGGNTLLVWRRGRADGAALNGLHLCFGIGALVSPVLVAWSLMARDDLVAASVAMALPTGAVAVWALLQPSPEPMRHDDEVGGEAPARSTLLVVSVFFFLYVGVEIGFSGWVHTYAQAIHLGGDATAAALNATFWGAFLLGRFLAVGLALRWRPGRLLAVAGAVSIGGAAVLAASGGGAALVWSGTVLFGLAIAPLYPTMLAYVGDHLVLTGAATAWFVGGSAVGGLTLPWLIGQLFDRRGPSAMPVTVLVATVACIAWILVVRAILPGVRASGARPAVGPVPPDRGSRIQRRDVGEIGRPFDGSADPDGPVDASHHAPAGGRVDGRDSRAVRGGGTG